MGRFEADLFRLINDLPSWLTGPLIVVMQAGSLAAVFVAGGLALAARRPLLARDLIASGTLTWLAPKAVKAVVGHARPAALLHGVVLRAGAPVVGLGFPSGHAAVAAALATAAAPHLGRRARRIASRRATRSKAAASQRRWNTERIHHSDTFGRLLTRASPPKC